MVIDQDKERKYGDIRYAQGLVRIRPTGVAMLHAWCVTARDEVLDATVPTRTFSDHDYFGIAFPVEAVGLWVGRTRIMGWIPLQLATGSIADVM